MKIDSIYSTSNPLLSLLHEKAWDVFAENPNLEFSKKRRSMSRGSGYQRILGSSPKSGTVYVNSPQKHVCLTKMYMRVLYMSSAV